MVKHKGIRVEKRKKAKPPKQPYSLNYKLFSDIALVVPFVSWGLNTILADSFASKRDVMTFAFWASVLLTLAALCLFYALSSLKLLYPRPEFSDCSGTGKALKLFGYGLSLSVTLWTTLSGTLPMLYTLAAGERGEKYAMVERKDYSTRGCSYAIRSTGGTDSFKECISREEYLYLPEGPVLVSIDQTASTLGYYVHDYNYFVGTIEYELPK